jgi:hypothetical protein
MTTRRAFLFHTALVTSLPAFALPSGGGRSCLPIVADFRCRALLPDSCGPCLPLNCDPAHGLLTVQALLDTEDFTAIAGVTRDSDAFLFGSILRPAGFIACYSGSHRLAGGMLEHRLSGAQAALDTFAETVKVSGDAWLTALVDIFPALVRAGGEAATRTVAHATPSPTPPAHLSSWIWSRA